LGDYLKEHYSKKAGVVKGGTFALQS